MPRPRAVRYVLWRTFCLSTDVAGARAMASPPIQAGRDILRAFKSRMADFLRPSGAGPKQGQEMGAEFYDKAFESVTSYHKHYTESEYYFLWTVIVDRIRRAKSTSILEIGCGPGQLARAIHDAIPRI